MFRELEESLKNVAPLEIVSETQSELRTSSRDGGIGRRGLPLHTTTSKLQLKCRTTITQNHQKSS